ncbi:MAG: MBL fold metallo-hydrolase [Halobacteriota archaeon]
MTSLTFYGGVAEIGGNKILLEDQDTRVFLDFGMSFGLANQYFDEFMQPRKCNGMLDLLEFGLLPDLDGLYRCDYLQHCRCSFEPEPSIDGVLLSHAHMDHCSYIHYLRDDVPIHCSQASKDIMQALDDTGSTGTCELISFKESFTTYTNSKGGESKLQGEKAKKPRPYEVVNSAFNVGALSTEALSVSHSLEGATSYILDTSAGSVVYTGDFRFHGYKGNETKRFIERAAAAEPVAMICEGTRVNSTQSDSEEQVKEIVKERAEKTKSLVVANFPVRDTDRMQSFFEAAQQTDRALVINLKQAYLLELFKQSGIRTPRLNDEHIRVYIPRKGWGVYKDGRFSEKIQQQDYDLWEREFLDHPHAVTATDIRDDQGSYIFRCDFFELKELIDIRPEPGSYYIRSTCEPFDVEMELDLKKVENWLTHFGLYPYTQIHASGHLSYDDIRDVVETVQPKTLIPVHTQYPEVFQGFHDNVVLPKKGVEITL